MNRYCFFLGWLLLFVSCSQDMDSYPYDLEYLEQEGVFEEVLLLKRVKSANKLNAFFEQHIDTMLLVNQGMFDGSGIYLTSTEGHDYSLRPDYSQVFSNGENKELWDYSKQGNQLTNGSYAISLRRNGDNYFCLISFNNFTQKIEYDEYERSETDSSVLYTTTRSFSYIANGYQTMEFSVEDFPIKGASDAVPLVYSFRENMHYSLNGKEYDSYGFMEKEYSPNKLNEGSGEIVVEDKISGSIFRWKIIQAIQWDWNCIYSQLPVAGKEELSVNGQYNYEVSYGSENEDCVRSIRINSLASDTTLLVQ